MVVEMLLELRKSAVLDSFNASKQGRGVTPSYFLHWFEGRDVNGEMELAVMLQALLRGQEEKGGKGTEFFILGPGWAGEFSEGGDTAFNFGGRQGEASGG